MSSYETDQVLYATWHSNWIFDYFRPTWEKTDEGYYWDPNALAPDGVSIGAMVKYQAKTEYGYTWVRTFYNYARHMDVRHPTDYKSELGLLAAPDTIQSSIGVGQDGSGETVFTPLIYSPGNQTIIPDTLYSCTYEEVSKLGEGAGMVRLSQEWTLHTRYYYIKDALSVAPFPEELIAVPNEEVEE